MMDPHQNISIERKDQQ